MVRLYSISVCRNPPTSTTGVPPGLLGFATRAIGGMARPASGRRSTRVVTADEATTSTTAAAASCTRVLHPAAHRFPELGAPVEEVVCAGKATTLRVSSARLRPGHRSSSGNTDFGRSDVDSSIDLS